MAGFNARHASPAKQRKSARQQVADAKQQIRQDIMASLRDKKRSIPKEWERGFLAAMSVIEQELGE